MGCCELILGFPLGGRITWVCDPQSDQMARSKHPYKPFRHEIQQRTQWTRLPRDSRVFRIKSEMIYLTYLRDEKRVVSGKKTFFFACDEWDGSPDLFIETFFAQKAGIYEVYPAVCVSVPSLPRSIPPSK